MRTSIIYVHIYNSVCKSDEKDNYQIEFKNCIIRNNEPLTYGLITLIPEEKSFFNDNLPKCISVSVTNSILSGNKSIFSLIRGNLNIDNCIIEYSDSVETMNASIIMSENINNRIDIKNSKFINNITNMPLFYLIKADIEIRNTTFINNHSTSGNLIHGEYISNEYNNKLIITDSFFSENDNIINGKNNDIIISNCEFKDTELKSSLPIVSNCINSNIQIGNSNFRNLKIQGNGLVGPESTYTLNNVTLSDIVTNGKSLFRFLNKNIKFNNVTFNSIKNAGEINESSIIYFDSG
ncbi:hypothetical protein BCR36DRAFT_323194, partial [Piromyces finnis]